MCPICQKTIGPGERVYKLEAGIVHLLCGGIESGARRPVKKIVKMGGKQKAVSDVFIYH